MTLVKLLWVLNRKVWTHQALSPPGQELLCASPHLPHCQPCELPWPAATPLSYPSCPVSKATYGSDPGCRGGRVTEGASVGGTALFSSLSPAGQSSHFPCPCVAPAQTWLSPDPPSFSPHYQLTSRIWCHPLSLVALAATAAATASQPLCDYGKVLVALKKGPGTRAGGRGLLCGVKRTAGSSVLCCP